MWRGSGEEGHRPKCGCRVPSEEGLKRVPGRKAELAPAASGKGGLSRLGEQRSGACTHVEGLLAPLTS